MLSFQTNWGLIDSVQNQTQVHANANSLTWFNNTSSKWAQAAGNQERFSSLPLLNKILLPPQSHQRQSPATTPRTSIADPTGALFVMIRQTIRFLPQFQCQSLATRLFLSSPHNWTKVKQYFRARSLGAHRFFVWVWAKSKKSLSENIARIANAVQCHN